MISYEEDWFMRQIKGAVFNPFKKNSEVQLLPMIQVTDEETGKKEFVPIQNYLLELLLKLEINQAENILFTESEQMTNRQFSELGTWFYDYLDSLSDAELDKANFTRDEIIQGRADLGSPK